MQIKINQNNEIISYAIVGTIQGGVDVTIPQAVIKDGILSYKYVNGEFVKNGTYQPPTPQLSEIELLKAQNKALSDRLDFTEDVIAEMVMIVYAE